MLILIIRFYIYGSKPVLCEGFTVILLIKKGCFYGLVERCVCRICTIHKLKLVQSDSLLPTPQPALATVRKAVLADIPAIHAIHKAWQRPELSDLRGGFLSVYYNTSELEEICDAGDLIAIESNGCIRGCSFVNNAIPKPHKQLVLAWLSEHNISVDGVGIGYSVMLAEGLKNQGASSQIANHVYNLFAETYNWLCSTISKLNEPSSKMHKRVGFSFYDVHPDYWIILKNIRK